MLTYSFDNIGSKKMYIYLYECIKNDIIENKLKSGMKLPSKRAFATNLGISVVTVESAYAQLQSEGYIYSLEKKGFYVSEIKNNLQYQNEQKSYIPRRTFTAEAEEFKINLANNSLNSKMFPFSIWSKLLRQVIVQKEGELLQKQPCGGVYELRAAIADYLHQFKNMNVEPNQIIIGSGNEYLYGLIIQLFGKEKVYAIENPGYKKIAQVYESNCVVCKKINLDDDGVKVSELEDAKADIVHISPSHHFPTGIVTPISRRYELLSWANKNEGRFIIEDDYDSEFRMNGKPIPPLQVIDVSGKVIYMNTFTKTISPTIRISYMVLPPTLMERFYKKLGFYSSTVSSFEQYTLSLFISLGYFEKHINRMRNYYKEIRNQMLLEIKKSELNKICTVLEEDSGLHFLLHLSTDISDEELMKKGESVGLKIAFVSQYYSGVISEDLNHTIIVNYSGLKKEEVVEAVALLNKAIFL